jgi:hypothetical protein
MTKDIRKVMVVGVLCGVFLAMPLYGLTKAPERAGAGNPTPGVEAAQSISMITGVAISPLLGVGVVGLHQYWITAPEKRAALPWYAQPWFWLPALLLVAAVGLKDTAGTALPPGLKKPFDVAETVENKISGLVAVGAFVPLVANFFPEAVNPGATAGLGSSLAGHGFAMIDAAAILNVLTIPFAMAAFALVWLVSHATHILILLSPWGVIDAALKSARMFVLLLLAGTAWINPYAGATLSILIIIISYFLAGWAMRLTIFGQVYVWDFLTLRRFRFSPGYDANWMFLARQIQNVPTRTYGKLIRGDDGQLTFQYRPWLILPARTLELPSGRYAVGRGLIFSEIVAVEGEKTPPVLIFPPRYRSHEDDLARIYQITVQDVGLLKGFKKVWNRLFGQKTEPAMAT